MIYVFLVGLITILSGFATVLFSKFMNNVSNNENKNERTVFYIGVLCLIIGYTCLFFNIIFDSWNKKYTLDLNSKRIKAVLV